MASRPATLSTALSTVGEQSILYNSRAKTITKQNRFLEAYKRIGTITHACKAAGIDSKLHYQWLSTSYLEDGITYAQRFAAAHEQAIEALELEARRRAVEGVEEPVGWYKGVPGGYVKRYSDVLLIFLLKGARPEKYRERFEHSGPNGGPIQTQHATINVDEMPEDLRRQLVQFMEAKNITPVEEIGSEDQDEVINGSISRVSPMPIMDDD